MAEPEEVQQIERIPITWDPTREKWLEDPLMWIRPRRITVKATDPALDWRSTDLFSESIGSDYLDRIFAVMAVTPHHTYQILTNNADRMQSYLSGPYFPESRVHAHIIASYAGYAPFIAPTWPLPNVWLGVQAVNQSSVTINTPKLLATPAARRWLSLNPLSAEVELFPYLTHYRCSNCDAADTLHPADSQMFEFCSDHTIDIINGVDWVVLQGGDTPVHPDWVRAVRDRCVASNTPFTFKGWGAFCPEDHIYRDYTGWVPEVINSAAEAVLHNHQLSPEALAHQFEEDNLRTYHVGREAAGRKLDGEVWDQYPQELLLQDSRVTEVKRVVEIIQVTQPNQEENS